MRTNDIIAAGLALGAALVIGDRLWTIGLAAGMILAALALTKQPERGSVAGGQAPAPEVAEDSPQRHAKSGEGAFKRKGDPNEREGTEAYRDL